MSARPNSHLHRARRRRRELLVAGAAALVLLGSAPAAGGGPADAEPILDALLGLESQRDAKCYSTFCRFENFLHGTPLTEGARIANTVEQKNLARRIWMQAGEAASSRGSRFLGAPDIRKAAAGLLQVSDREDGSVTVKAPGGEALAIPAVRVRQYASIAYSLRAILSIQQDNLLDPSAGLLPLRSDGVDALRSTLDRAAIAALMIADRSAREDDRKEIGEEAIRQAWSRLVPGKDRGEAPVSPEGAPAGPPPDPEAVSGAMKIFFQLIKEKVEAYSRYNNLEDEGKRLLLFGKNMERFFTRHSHAASLDESSAFIRTFWGSATEFAGRLLREAASRAEENGRGIVRSADAFAAVERHLPHEIDDFEDVHLFPRLPREERLVLEAYDGDSMRDFGFHWIMMGDAIQSGGDIRLAPDPYAAEILAEAVSINSLAILRTAGLLAKESDETRTLSPRDLEKASNLLAARAEKNARAPVRRRFEEPIISASADSGGAKGSFTDGTERSGVRFIHRSAGWLSEFRRSIPTSPPTFSGGGVAAEDVDGDGDHDLLLVGGAGIALYLNDGKGRFRDATVEAGLAEQDEGGDPGEARQPLIADMDNDGLPEILVTYVNAPHRLWQGTGPGRFREVTGRAGLGGPGLIGGPATLFDMDGDGLLDLYICNFGDYLSGETPRQARHNDNAQPNRLFRNSGGLVFTDVTAGSGTADRGWCQAVSHTDVDRDGRQDIIVANDFGRNAIFRNKGGGRFENVAEGLGWTKAYHSMNVGISDLNEDDFPDIYVSNIATVVKDNKYVLPSEETVLDFDPQAMATMIVKESDILYMSRAGAGGLESYSASNLLERGTISTGWAWDAEFLDYDNDGDDDLYVVNGSNPYFMRGLMKGMTQHEYFYNYYKDTRNVLFANDGGRLRNVSQGSGADYVGNSRSTAYLDLEGDGDLDIALNDFHSPARILVNRSAAPNSRWAKVKLQGDPSRGVNRDAIGARIIATSGDGLRVVREVQGGSGYLSMNPKEQHLGLGDARRFDLRVIWPDGTEQVVKSLKSNRRHLVRQDGPSGVRRAARRP